MASTVKTPSHVVLVGCGELVPKLYLPAIEKGIREGYVASYSIIDFDSQSRVVRERASRATVQPEHILFIPNRRDSGIFADPEDFGPILRHLSEEKGRIRIIIAAEVKAHEGYLRYCVENNIDSLVEKPVFVPLKDGYFDPASIEAVMQGLIATAGENIARHSVMTLGRYSSIYDDEIFQPIKKRVMEYGAPITSLHLRTSSGVWNLYREYEEREDHPYKYGYGMLMHGAYHYVDLMAQFLNLNKLIFPDQEFELSVSSYGAYPYDQSDRIPKQFSEALEDVEPGWSKNSVRDLRFGETDVTTAFRLIRKKTGKTVTVGTLSLEQTSPSIRNWKELPEGIYNKNGRIPHTDIEVQLSTIFSMHARTYKLPKRKRIGGDVRLQNMAEISTRTNASMVHAKAYSTNKQFSAYFGNGKEKLLDAWLRGVENRSTLDTHMGTMRIIQAIALSLQRPGYPVTI